MLRQIHFSPNPFTSVCLTLLQYLRSASKACLWNGAVQHINLFQLLPPLPILKSPPDHVKTKKSRTKPPNMEQAEAEKPLASKLYKHYFNNPTLSDLTIRLSDRTVHAHRIVLCRGSQYFTALLTGNFQVSDHLSIGRHITKSRYIGGRIEGYRAS